MIKDEKETLLMNICSSIQNSLDLLRNNIVSGDFDNISIDDLSLCEYNMRELSLDNQYAEYAGPTDDIEILSLDELDEDIYFLEGDF